MRLDWLSIKTFPLFAASSISTMGNQANVLAISYYIKEATNSPLALSGILSSAALMAPLFLPIGGHIGTVFPRKLALIILSLTSACLSVLMAFASMEKDQLSIIVVAGGVIGLALVSNLYTPIFRSIVTDIVPQENLLSVNGKLHGTNNLSSALGQAACAALYNLIKVPGLLILDALTYAAAALAFAKLKLHQSKIDTSNGTDKQQKSWKKMIDFSLLKGKPLIVRELIFIAFINLLISPLAIYLPFVATGGGQQLAIHYTAISVGAILGGFLISRMKRWKSASLIILLGFSRVGLGMRDDPLWTSLAVFSESFFMSIISVRLITRVQLVTEAAMQARVMALMGSIVAPLIPLGFMVGGLLFEQWKHAKGEVMVILGLIICCIGVIDFLSEPKHRRV